MACLVRVPTENVKQKMQAGLYNSATETVQGVLQQQGCRGFYTGYLTTVMREVRCFPTSLTNYCSVPALLNQKNRSFIS